ncbi:P-type conjugative transfer protein TrbL [Xanthomonas hortorum pv. vitians]|uniref:P-type conjugative transfer protein TrbL n=1 Tax=Xanthomonas hortorum TaxID=56454 RepID=UPI0012A78039|nr:P-type conjugative transfer protein TrbL [Xanthomonas hortorum]MCE4282556.1 P-type conjugative transfer protein TrbL [Xanthomonas hortorum pv. vitians]MCE4287409.1 P-type conjugative transfer protein TrbL [Xanthomonas hortorum pv. vitians]MCE4291835.1 P-type conjugative transfer protein TrbL [Xanthomonas hortorum pv. vitians]MCE4296134.1 P-type conjugative transfer protein TrbL [Xanthomonas hortorum pv. vitians]MDT7854885.1 P-type conjugative transfer protein TrbL [Xanthomonas hortorum pv. 
MKRMAFALSVGLAFALFSTGASAELTNQGMLDQVVTEFASKASSWKTVIMDAATWLFWTLGTISLVWTGGTLVMKRADVGEFFAEFVRFILFFGFYLWLLRNGPEIADAIIQSLQQLGSKATGISSVTPSGIVDVGFMIFQQHVKNSSLWSPVDTVIGAILSLGILLLLATISVNMLLVLVSSWCLMYLGIFFLGFGGSRWTSDMAINYYKTVLGVGVNLLVMVALVGIGNDLLTGFYAKMGKGTLNFEEMGVMLVFCLALLLLINRVPPLISGIITGGGVGAAGGLGHFGAGAVVGAGMAAAGMAAQAVAAAASGGASLAASAAGGAQAVMAAASAAAKAADGGGGGMSNAGGGGEWGGVGVAGGEPMAAASGGGGSPMAQAAGDGASGGSGSSGGGSSSGGGKAGQIAKGTVANLAKGIGSMASAKAGSMAEAAKSRIAETTGGKLAATIKAASSSTADNSPSSSNDNAPAAAGNDEVAAFVNRPQTT